MELTVKTTEPDDRLFLRRSWVDGTGDGVKFDLSCGAGLGSSIVHLTVELEDGRRMYSTFDMASVLVGWVDGIVEKLRAVGVG